MSDLELDADVIVVGYGPVGQVVSALLGAGGHSIIVLEKHPDAYPTPRAGHFDHEIMRIFQAMGISDEVSEVSIPARQYEFWDGAGTVFAQLPRDWITPSGWDASYHFYQPSLERVLDAAVRRQGTVHVRRGVTVTEVAEIRDGVKVKAEVEHGRAIELTGRYVIGADGANSVVRTDAGISLADLGFKADWLVVDVRMNPDAEVPHVPDTGQVCDPERPSHMAHMYDRYYRWEFMVMPGDDVSDITSTQGVWSLLKTWLSPDAAVIVRSTVYTFRSMLASKFRCGRMLLAGDSAHLMPPFLGQGMCSGIRDAGTLVWMLDLVLKGWSPPDLLDQYTLIRAPHVRSYIDESVRVGELVCETDPVRASEYAQTMSSVHALPPPFQPRTGALYRSTDSVAGHLSVQPWVHASGQTSRLDDITGSGFRLLRLADAPPPVAQVEAALELLGVRRVDIAPGPDSRQGALQESGSAFRQWMVSAGAISVIVRPDFYVFGTARSPDEEVKLLEDLRTALLVR